MAIDNKIFVGGLNTDDEDRLIPNGDYRYALNIRNSKSDSDSQGSIENVKGNEVVSYSLGSGTHKCVGAYDDKLNNKVYYFVWSSLGLHKLLEYDVEANIVNLVIESNLLNLSDKELIFEQNIAILDGKLYWLNKQPYKVNIEKAITGGYPSPLRYEHISAIVEPPVNPPSCEWGSDDSVKTNNVRGNLYQFRYKFVYEDNEESAWSPISKVELPIDEGVYRPFAFYDTVLNNYIDVSVSTGNELVKRIKIAFREKNTGDFYLAKDVDKSDIPSTNASYTFRFFNNEVPTSLDNDGTKGMRLFDWMPLEANAQALIDGNKLAYGGVTENYDPVKIDINVSPVYNELPDIEGVLAGNPISYQSPGGMFGFNPADKTLYTGNNYGNSINGSTYFMKWSKFGIPTYAGVSPLAGNQGFSDVLYLEDSPGGLTNNGIVVVSQHSLELALANDINGEVPEGNRVIASVEVEWRNFKTNSWVKKKFNWQTTAELINGANPNAYQVLSKLRDQINNYGAYTADGARITFAAKVSGYSRGFGSNLPSNWNGGSVLYIQVGGVIDEADVSITNIPNSGYSNYFTNFVGSGYGHPCLYGVKLDYKSYAEWTTNIEKTLKMGARHEIGLVYYDQFNRSTLANISDQSKFYVKFPTERGIGQDKITDVVELDVEINHTPPSWATHYQFVYTGNQTIEKIEVDEGYKGFIQLKLDNVTASATVSGALQSTLNNLFNYGDSVPELTDITYGFTKGDRIRFIKDSNGDFYQEYIDVEVISFDQSTNLLTFKNPDKGISGAVVAEIYTPRKQTTNNYYYEIGEKFTIVNGLHDGNTQAQTLSSPAVVRLLDIGDVYLRYRENPMATQVEDYNFSDYYDSDSWDRGRTYIEDKNIKQTYRPTTIRYTEAYIPETNINGLSQVNDFNFEAYDQKYGDIMLLYSEDKLLNVFQRLKVGAIGINQDVIYGDAGEVVSTSRNENRVLSKSIRYYAGEYGIGNNPESFAVYGNMKYFVDVKRGAVLRLGGDGLTPISEYKMHNYFNDKFTELDTIESKILGVYDTRFDEYIIHMINENVSETIAYSEGKNRWTTFYSYAPDFMVSNRVGLITFKDGVLYNHNLSDEYNNFYGLQYNSQIRFISNLEPTKIKVYDFITQDATNAWYMPEAVNQYGQKTSLIVDDFEDVEGVFKTAFLRDENTPNVSYPLIEGDSMRSHSLDITLENDSIEFQKLFSVGVGQHLSELTNR